MAFRVSIGMRKINFLAEIFASVVEICFSMSSGVLSLIEAMDPNNCIHRMAVIFSPWDDYLRPLARRR